MIPFFRRLVVEVRDLVEVVLIPGVAIFLPWRLCFKLFKLLSKIKFIYEVDCSRSLSNAKKMGWVKDDAEWILNHRLVKIIDHADHYLVRTRSNRWLKKFVTAEGQWPQPNEAALLLTFHWGNGMWALRHAQKSKMHVHFLLAAAEGHPYKGRWILHQYAKSRLETAARALQSPIVMVSMESEAQRRVDFSKITKPLQNGEQVMAVIDVPSDQVGATMSIDFLRCQAKVPTKLLKLAADLKVPVVVYLAGMRLSDGQRILKFQKIVSHSEPALMVKDVFRCLEDAISERPEAWHLWGEAERFFSKNE